jgi:hypothetical protein
MNINNWLKTKARSWLGVEDVTSEAVAMYRLRDLIMREVFRCLKQEQDRDQCDVREVTRKYLANEDFIDGVISRIIKKQL